MTAGDDNHIVLTLLFVIHETIKYGLQHGNGALRQNE